MIVKNEKGKKIFTTSKGYVGFELMCEKAEEFEKENKREKNHSVKKKLFLAEWNNFYKSSSL